MPYGKTNQVTAASPRTVTVGTASGLVLPANLNRNGLEIVNSSSGHISGTLVASQVINANLNTAAQVNSYYNGLLLYVNITALSGTSPTLQVALQSQDPVSGAWGNCWQDASALNATGLYVYEMTPGSSSTGGLRAAFAQALPYSWRVALTLGGSGSPTVTASIGYNLIPITSGVGLPVSLGLGQPAVNGDDLVLFPGQSWTGFQGDDLWTGAVYAISPVAGATLSVAEM